MDLRTINQWKNRATVALMLVALVMAGNVFYSSSLQKTPDDSASMEDTIGDLTGTSLSRAAVDARMKESAYLAAHCRPKGGDGGRLEVEVTFRNDGRVERVEVLTERFHDTAAGACVRTVFRRTRLPTFTGPDVRLRQSLSIRQQDVTPGATAPL